VITFRGQHDGCCLIDFLLQVCSFYRRLEYRDRSMGVGKEEELVFVETQSTLSTRYNFFFHLNVDFHLDDYNMFPQPSALPIDSFYISSRSQTKSTPLSSPPSLRAPCTVPSLSPRSALSQSQRNDGRLDLSVCFAPNNHTARIHMSFLSKTHLSSFSLAWQPISPSRCHARAPSKFYLASS
jgi:hypothetical protein